ncbi:TonB-dependent siderophore receptor [Pelagicoccus albus]|uniref:TonB-dependent receptor plug domain-containing protein n=1 Tax=Pelagicoccus albus TaxID=415222 RepID=A0A7X1B7P7_9BACT|nr:TonB-dependent receptor plug domain-containing protein [Pelagicoccus albus]MBC2607082.1 TonB-dependent receptor plug domain-containing protein [Pelagicoccus albus]
MSNCTNIRRLLRVMPLVASVGFSLSYAQESEDPEEEIHELSPFTVDASDDQGYRATNTISGTRLNSAIKDIPMPIEVVTEEFLRDTGSSDLRESLRYSSGILLESQNDFSSPGGEASQTPGKVNNPSGLSGTAYRTSFKIRGFQTDSVLRDGFRRRHSTDSVNIQRVEVVRGPASLLYGVGNFGGVINYLVKQPSAEREGSVSVTMGSDDLKRTTFDYTDGLNEKGTLAFRVSGAYQDVGSFTDFDTEEHWFIAPILSYRPWEGTEILVDGEFGKQERDGIGWKSLRSVASNFINWDGGEAGGFLEVDGRDPKTFRWSGPDTYNHNESSNLELKLTQKLMENMYFLVGANSSSFDYEQRDNLASLELASNRSQAPDWAIGDVNFEAISPEAVGITTGVQPAVIAYQWEDKKEYNTTDQIRAELNYSFSLFEEKSELFGFQGDLLFGYTDTTEEREFHTFGTPGDGANFHNPTDPSYFRFGIQGDGVTTDVVMREQRNERFETSNDAFYGVFQGRFLDERLMLIAGARRDWTSNLTEIQNPQYRVDGSVGGSLDTVLTASEETSETTYQSGVSFRINKAISLYAMSSEGVQPNFAGYVDFRGVPITAALAKNEEFGLKFELFDGKLSGTFSKFDITRKRSPVGNPSSVWYAPVLTDANRFDPNSPIVYNISQWNPENGGAFQSALAAQDQWYDAVAAGSIYQATNSAGSTNWYVNASSAEGAAFMDAYTAATYTTGELGWHGWIYDQDSLTNNATLDYNGGSPPGPIGNTAVALGSDASTGWDTQFVYSPTEELQIVVSWAHTEKKVINAGGWIEYPYPEDRWAVWYSPHTWAGLGGLPIDEVYTDWTDTSTRISAGTGLALDDTPEDQGSLWANYSFSEGSRLDGFSFAIGASYEGPRQYFSGITHGGGAIIPDEDGDPLTLYTDSRFQLDAMLKYRFLIGENVASVQLNVNNVEDTQKLFGHVYQAPRSWRVSFDYDF